MHTVTIGPLTISNALPFTLFAGPCQLENRDHALRMSSSLKEMTDTLGIPFVYKTSFDKANRSSLHTQRGIGLEKAIPIFEEIRHTIGCPVMTDVHTQEQCTQIAPYVDVLQIPAFLCRQTDLLLAAGHSGKAVNIKKGQFLAPEDMKNIVEKVTSTGNKNVILCERGTTFGYHRLINDMRALPIMAQWQYPVMFDATHSVQEPGRHGGHSGGQRRFAPILARAALALGVSSLFIETHEDPDNAPSDGPNMIRLEDMPSFLRECVEFDTLAKAYPIRL